MKVKEVFRSLQGEGVLIGTPTVFIRTVGCNLDCEWCDTEYAKEGGEEMSFEQLLKKVEGLGARFVCLTGGEPLLQRDAVKLINKLVERCYHVTVETNGSISLEDVPCAESVLISMDIKCPSSGMEEKMMFSNIELLSPADQLKFIVADRRDLQYAEKIIEEYDPKCNVIFTPVGGLDLKPVAEFVLKKKINARVLPQLHKLIWGDARGV
ncbi:MAG TPA: radical SAM protein [Methanomassiliicoccales archaeon]|jgi:7-carboxy-7-deazaguanine synthase|nr:radical SAM protein [Methanomassiliicoccales archaeon]